MAERTQLTRSDHTKTTRSTSRTGFYSGKKTAYDFFQALITKTVRKCHHPLNLHHFADAALNPKS